MMTTPIQRDTVRVRLASEYANAIAAYWNAVDTPGEVKAYMLACSAAEALYIALGDYVIAKEDLQ